MAWKRELEDLERNAEKSIEDVEGNNINSSQTEVEENDLYTYARYSSTLQVLEELKALGEDVSEAFEFLEETWSKSECNPTNIKQKLQNGSEHISEDYYKEVQASLIDMEKDGHDVTEILRLLEENRARTGFDEGLTMEQELEKLENQLKLLAGKSFDEGDRTQDEK